MSRKPIILLGMYQVNDIYKLLIQNLEKQGFQVVDISYNHIAPPLQIFVFKNEVGGILVQKSPEAEKEKRNFEEKSPNFGISRTFIKK